MNSPLYFSIVVPLYNKKEYVNKTLESILNQTYPKFEAIIVDDGSTDGSLDEISCFDDSRLRIIKKSNGGVSSARNVGVENATYEHICFLDADDFWDTSYLENMLSLIGEFPNHLFYSSSFGYIYNREIIRNAFYSSNINKYQSIDIIRYGLGNRKCEFPINASNMIIKKEAFKLTGLFDERISFFEDYDLYVRLSEFSELAFFNADTPLSYYVKDIIAEKQATSKLPPYNKNFISLIVNVCESNESSLTKKYLRLFFAEYVLKYHLAKIDDVVFDLKRMKCRFLSFRFFILYSPIYFICCNFFKKK